MAETYRKVVLTGSVEGVPDPSNFKVIEDVSTPPGDGEFVSKHLYISLDPYQRPAMSGRHMSSPGALGEGDTPRAETIGQVTASKHPDFSEGDYVRHFGGWREQSHSDGTQAFKVNPARAPLSSYLGVLGMPGLTAYASIVKLANVKAGQTVLVSSAAGPVGATLGQIAIQKGAKAIGIAGSDEKCAFVTSEFGFDACVNYKHEDFAEALARATPNGVDIYHDNVGGAVLDAAFGVLNTYGTVILCGLASQYSDDGPRQGLFLGLPIVKRAIMKGLVIYDFEDQRSEFLDLVAPWVADSSIKFKEDRVEGIGNTAEQFCKLARGENFGKTLVVVGPEID